MVPSWVSHLWMKLGDRYIGRSVVSTASLSGRWANRNSYWTTTGLGRISRWRLVVYFGSDTFQQRRLTWLLGNFQVYPVFQWVWNLNIGCSYGSLVWKEAWCFNFFCSVNCDICNNQVMEECMHLFFECQFGKDC